MCELILSGCQDITVVAYIIVYDTNINMKYDTPKTNKFQWIITLNSSRSTVESVAIGCLKLKERSSQFIVVQTTQRAFFFAGLDVSSDEEFTSPLNFCNSCQLRIGRAKKARLSGFPFPPIQPMEWTPHQENCTVRN